MRSKRPLRPCLESLGARVLPSTIVLRPATHATPRSAEVIHFGGSGGTAEVAGVLRSGRPEYLRVVAAVDRVGATIAAQGGGAAKATVSLAGTGGGGIIDSTVPSGRGLTIGTTAASSIVVLIKVQGRGHFTLDLTASESSNLHVPGASPAVL